MVKSSKIAIFNLCVPLYSLNSLLAVTNPVDHLLFSAASAIFVCKLATKSN